MSALILQNLFLKSAFSLQFIRPYKKGSFLFLEITGTIKALEGR